MPTIAGSTAPVSDGPSRNATFVTYSVDPGTNCRSKFVVPNEMLPFVASVALLPFAPGPRREQFFPLDSEKGLELLYGASMDSTVFKGKHCVVMTEELDPAFGAPAIVSGLEFKDGTIDIDVAGTLTDNAGPGSRSFVGIAFRGSPDMAKYENFYLRMTNGRSPDQELRNHAVQYCMVPTYPWDLLRQRRPARYEAYTDLELGAWTHIKIWVKGTDAKFYVGNVAEPTLIVHGLLGGDRGGRVALWVHAHTHGYFANLRVRQS